MKRLISLSVCILLLSHAGMAQFEQVKTYLMLNQLPKAKEAIDELEKKGKVTTKPEFYAAKATILAGLMKGAEPAESAKLMNESIASYRKFMAADPTNAGKFIQDPTYSATPFTYYSTFFNEGISSFNKKEYDASSESFKNATEWSEFLIKNNQIGLAFDTSANYLAGASCQNAGKIDDALVYYNKLADNKIGGADYADMYKYMTYQYFLRDDAANFERTRSVGKELYPTDQFFTLDELDLILDMEDPNAKLAKLDAKVAKEPGNMKLAQMYGAILFDKLNERDVDVTTPAYAKEEEKMISLLTKTADAMPEDAGSIFYLGKHQWYKSDRIRAQIFDVNDAIRKFNDAQKPDKAGKLPPPPKDLTAKRDSLRKAQELAMDKAVPYLLKAQPIMEKTYTKSRGETQNYKILVDDLIQYYSFKRQYAKTNAEKVKFEAEEKKWDAIYTKIKA